MGRLNEWMNVKVSHKRKVEMIVPKKWVSCKSPFLSLFLSFLSFTLLSLIELNGIHSVMKRNKIYKFHNKREGRKLKGKKKVLICGTAETWPLHHFFSSLSAARLHRLTVCTDWLTAKDRHSQSLFASLSLSHTQSDRKPSFTCILHAQHPIHSIPIRS